MVLPGAVARTYDTPGFAGMTFYEVRAKSLISRVPGGENRRLPFEYTINPYRGCGHRCTYCLAGDTAVLLANGSTKPIAELRIGEEIVGTAVDEPGKHRRYVRSRVLAHWSTSRPAIRVTLHDGTDLICSSVHRFRTDHGWRRVCDLVVGDRLQGAGRSRRRIDIGMPVRSSRRLSITKIEPLGIILPMFDITTSSRDFIADGIVSHNCFARHTHTYLDLDAGHDFDSKIVVKVNAVELLRRELGSARWRGDPIAMGTNVDCYQRAEGRYQLMPGIIRALTEAANPFSILTKGTLILRDLDLLQQAATRTDVRVSFSVGFLDDALWRTVEAGAPSPQRRLDAIRAFAAAGWPVPVLLAPVLPGLTDSEEQLDATVAALAAAGADSAMPLVLHLRPGAREWYLSWLRQHHPELLPLYRQIYGESSYASADYQRLITARGRRACRRHGLRLTQDPARQQRAAQQDAEAMTQLKLL